MARNPDLPVTDDFLSTALGLNHTFAVPKLPGAVNADTSARIGSSANDAVKPTPQSLLAPLLHTTHARDIYQTLSELVGYLGCRYYFFAAYDRNRPDAEAFRLYDNTPRDWRDTYLTSGLFALDRANLYARTHCAPVLFNLADDGFFADGAVRLALRKLQLHSGVVAPAHSPTGMSGYLMLGYHDQGLPAAGQLHMAMSTAAHAAGVLLEVDERLHRHGEPASRRVNLSRREVECLQWAAAGKTAWETGVILDITERTVVFHLCNATQKLSASNKQQAIARAIALGLVESSAA